MLAVSLGSPAGISYDTTFFAIKKLGVEDDVVLFGAHNIIEKYIKIYSIKLKFHSVGEFYGDYDRDSLEAGKISYMSIVAAAEFSKKHNINLYTAPVSKRSIRMAGYDFNGHTDLLKEIFGVEDVAMFLFSGHMRFVLLTEHIKIADVEKNLEPQIAAKKIILADNFLRNFIKTPRWVFMGVNPHIEYDFDVNFFNAVKNITGIKMDIFPSDVAAMYIKHGVYDAGVAAYHDAAMVALKVFDPSRIVNLTLGLPVLRTSPGHGVGYGAKNINYTPALTAMQFLYEAKVRTGFFKG